MNVKHTDQLSSHISSRRYFVRKRDIIDLTLIKTSNENCCGEEEKKPRIPSIKIKTLPKIKKSTISIRNERIIDVPKQTKIPEAVPFGKVSLCYEALDNAWPLSNERVENLIITNKRCYFSNEPVSIKPITAVPGIGQKYGQILADHGFIYARQLLGYYLILKDSEMFRKWLEYQFHIPKFRAAEITSALNELIRRTL